MESIGKKLKTTREEKGYSPDQVARDTNIARRFILAMEEENFSALPGDTYLLGFLRNYADYLGLDPEDIVNLYRNMQLQEQPIPMEELLHAKKRRPPRKVVLLVLALLVLTGGGSYLVYELLLSSNGDQTATAEEQAAQVPEEGEGEDEELVFKMEEKIVTRRFREGEQILIDFGEGNIPLNIREVDGEVSLGSPEGELSLSLGQEVSLDMSLDGRDDLMLEVQDIDSHGGTVVLRLDRGIAGAEISSDEGEAGGLVELGTSTVSERRQEPLTIDRRDTLEPFQLNIEFRGYSMVRYLLDGEIREQRYFRRGENLRLDVDREVMLWISNAGNLNARAAGRELDFGGPGEVAVKLLRWERNQDGQDYELRLLPVY
ncbi:MAG TPA: helix-turn-helix domain-containing protein [Sediminispirochaeta sp.]|nr:helix-turn-helix domain-containing protein [Sediminispirochaeta sp.]